MVFVVLVAHVSSLSDLARARSRACNGGPHTCCLEGYPPPESSVTCHGKP